MSGVSVLGESGYCRHERLCSAGTENACILPCQRHTGSARRTSLRQGRASENCWRRTCSPRVHHGRPHPLCLLAFPLAQRRGLKGYVGSPTQHHFMSRAGCPHFVRTRPNNTLVHHLVCCLSFASSRELHRTCSGASCHDWCLPLPSPRLCQIVLGSLGAIEHVFPNATRPVSSCIDGLCLNLLGNPHHHVCQHALQTGFLGTLLYPCDSGCHWIRWILFGGGFFGIPLMQSKRSPRDCFC